MLKDLGVIPIIVFVAFLIMVAIAAYTLGHANGMMQEAERTVRHIRGDRP